MKNHTTLGESNIKYEIMRYVANPGQVGLIRQKPSSNNEIITGLALVGISLMPLFYFQNLSIKTSTIYNLGGC